MEVERPHFSFKNENWTNIKKDLKAKRQQRQNKNLKQIQQSELTSNNEFNYMRIDAIPSLKPAPKYCDVTGFEELQDAQTALREVTLRYSLIILKWGNLELRNRDQHFFETTIYFICQILKEFYSRSDFYFIEEEVNRLFRTNIFNITKRRHIEDQKVKKYPVLKENKIKQPMENILANLQKRRFIPQTRLNKEMSKENSNYRPFFLKSSPCASTQSRSPLVSEFYPAKREALYQLEKNKQQSQYQEMLKKKQYFSKSNQFNIIDNQKGLHEQINSFSHKEVLENFKNQIKSRNLQIDLTNNNKTFLNNNRTFKLSPVKNNIPENRIKSFQILQKQRVRNKTMI
ncbi:hypothetical protein PPERSA_09646 [Pseudocohnilembus persalinus]|uniref:Uncharacterized protein n=1 Tax=Pseudocohnilembus persalinus TaxID=266149 RepID=A0A0V0R6X2_PSEPJ|nr:hypothetical protein PPERSA_09646 [Pseudocohnilembus persalinus]|eukprot:KRX10262.1 hypothetical protein PPERSA_09646 [Pseudocohnilembus persalinus]